MEFKRKGLKKNGFQGFYPMSELIKAKTNCIPQGGGVYVVLREIESYPDFLKSNPGGWFKGKDPTVTMTKLKQQWVNGAHVIYIGKGDKLQQRVNRLLKFGMGKGVSHRGGRLIWQIEGSDRFILAWKELKPGENPKRFESHLLQVFIKSYGCLPFANLQK